MLEYLILNYLGYWSAVDDVQESVSYSCAHEILN